MFKISSDRRILFLMFGADADSRQSGVLSAFGRQVNRIPVMTHATKLAHPEQSEILSSQRVSVRFC